MPRKAESVKVMLLKQNNSKTRRLTQKELERRKNNEEKLDIGADNIVAPRWVSPEVKEHFYKIRDMLASTELLRNSDVNLLVMYAVAWEDFKRATVENLGSKEKRDTSSQVMKIGKELGLSPSARASLAIKLGGDEPDDDEKDEFDD